MPVVTVREDLRTLVAGRLRSHIAARARIAQRYGEHYVHLWRLTDEHVLGGKMLRPQLLIDMHRALTPEALPVTDEYTVVDLAAAIELLHYAFLLHDDVIDGDSRRRGSPNLISVVRDAHPAPDGMAAAADHWGYSNAILMGDLLLSAVHQIFARAVLAPGLRLRLLDLLDHTITETIAGEHTDIALSDRVVASDLRTILTMTAHKTASYTFELPLRIAAIVAGHSPAVEDALRVAGRHLGLAFQLQDDILSVFGDPAVHGKDAYSDLREGKETALIAYARMTGAWAAIEPRFGTPDLTEEEGRLIAHGLRACGSETFVLQLIGEELAAARACLTESPASRILPAPARAVLLDVAHRIDGRQS